MGTETQTKDYITLLNEDIPNGRNDLINTSKALEDVAQYCLKSYDKSLEQTVNYTAQALGSVAYKINLIATNFLEVLEQQNVKLNGLQSKVNHLNMQVRIHQEKTARLSIGKYSLPRDSSAFHTSKNISPILEINGTYRRKLIDFTILDNIGHGVNDARLGGSVAAYDSISRQSSASGVGSDNNSLNFAYSQSNSKPSSEGNLKYGKLQSSGKLGNVAPTNFDVNNILRNARSDSKRSAIQMMSPVLVSAHSTPPPPSFIQSPPHSTHCSNSLTPKPYQIPILSPLRKYSTDSNITPPQYGYSGLTHPMANIPPPPLPNCKTPTTTVSFDHLPPPPPPIEQSPKNSLNTSYQSPLSPVSQPPLSNIVEQTNYNTTINGQTTNEEQAFKSVEYVPIQHLQLDENDPMRYKEPGDPAWVPSKYLCKVISLYDYQRNNVDELDFTEREIIYVVKKNPDGWWRGIIRTGEGLFPGNYVQVID